MSSDAMTGAADAATATADLADASRRLLEQSFNTGNLELIDRSLADPRSAAAAADAQGFDRAGAAGGAHLGFACRP